MAYQDLIFNNLAGKVVGIYNDNNLQRDVEIPLASPRRIIATGTATAGARNELFNVRSINTAMQTFGNDSEIATIIQRVANINTNFNLSVMRIGSKPFHWRLKQDIAGSYEKEPLISIVPVFVQEKDATQNIFSTLENLKIVLMPFVDNNVIRQRVILFNHDRNPDSTNAIYDSERLLVANGEVGFEVTIDVPYGTVLYTPNAFSANTQIGNGYTDAQLATLSEVNAFLTDSMTVLSDEANFDTAISSINTINRSVNTLSGITGYHLDVYAGKSQKKLNYCERYINNEEAYRVLEFQNADFLYCEGCFADIKPVSLIGKNAAFALNWASENLGYLWKYVFNGRSYSYMFRTAEPFTNTLVTSTYTNDGVTYNFSASNKLLGDLLNLVEIHLHPKAQGTATDIETFSNEKGIIECHVDFDCDPTTATDARGRTEAEFVLLAGYNDANNDGEDDVTGLNNAAHTAYVDAGWIEAVGTITLQTPFCELQFDVTKFNDGDADYTKRLRPSLIDVSDAVSTLLRNGDSGNNDPFVISHWDMAQDEIPEGVIARLINFPETGASAATLVASNLEVREVSFLHQVAQAAYQASSNYNHTVGLVPTSHPSSSKTGLHVWAGNPAEYEVKEDGSIVVTKNGTGILGNKLLAGEVGYRDSAAFGGIILTNGEDLPNDLPYGIDDSDEALDVNNNPIDLGKHVVVVGSYGYVPDPRNSFTANRGKVSRINPFNNPLYVNAGPSIAQILCDLPPGNEPIGPVNGAVAGFNNRMQTPRQILNNLAALRICMIGQDSVISSIYTAALRTSDYTKISSIISSNEILKRVRQYAAPVLGQALSDATINSLDTTMLGLSNALKNEGYAQACRIQLRANRLDRINGVLNARVSFVPPFSLETINVDITLEAPAV